MKTLFLKPARDDLVVRNPANREALPAEGKSMPDTPYWRRRLKDRDVVETKPPKPVAKDKEA